MRNESYQAFIDINSNNYHDSIDYPTASQALTPTDNTFTDEIKINNLKIGLDYEIYDSYHLQFEFDQWNNKGNNNLLSSIYPGYIKGKNRFNISLSKFSKYSANNAFEKINFRSGIFFVNYDIKSKWLEKLSDVSEDGLALGYGVRYGLTNNQLDLSYNFIQRDNIYKVGVENIQAFNVGISIGDLWFVKRREI